MLVTGWVRLPKDTSTSTKSPTPGFGVSRFRKNGNPLEVAVLGRRKRIFLAIKKADGQSVVRIYKAVSIRINMLQVYWTASEGVIPVAGVLTIRSREALPLVGPSRPIK